MATKAVVVAVVEEEEEAGWADAQAGDIWRISSKASSSSAALTKT